MTDAEINVGLKKEPSTKWLRFYLHGYMYVKLIACVLAIPEVFNLLPLIALWVGAGYNLFATVALLAILVIVSTIVVFIKTRTSRISGYKWLIVMIWSNFIAFALWAFLLERDYRLSGIDPLPGFTFAAIMIHLFIWTVPNLIYFSKRKHLFHTAKEKVAIEPMVPTPVRLARKHCSYKPTKTKVDMRKLRGMGKHVTRFATLIRKNSKK